MGGSSTELSAESTDVVVEAAHFDPVAVARSARRHRLSTEASRRFERGVDADLAAAAADRVVELLVRLGGATAATRRHRRRPAPAHRSHRPGAGPPVSSGRRRPSATTRYVGTWSRSGAPSSDGAEPGAVQVTPPSWRPDLQQPADLVEEVARLHGYDAHPVGAAAGRPRAPPGPAAPRRAHRGPRPGRARVRRGQVVPVRLESGTGRHGHARPTTRDGGRCAWPTRCRTRSHCCARACCPGCWRRRAATSGGATPDLAIFETGRVFLPAADAPPAPAAAGGPPAERRRAGRAGRRRPGPAGARGTGADRAARAARLVGAGGARLAGVTRWTRSGPGRGGHGAPGPRSAAAEHAPWHPGRCAAIVVAGPDGERTVGRVRGRAAPAGLRRAGPAGADVRSRGGAARPRRPGRTRSPGAARVGFPVATQDVALVVAAQVPAADVQAALRRRCRPAAGVGPALRRLRRRPGRRPAASRSPSRCGCAPRTGR